MPLPTTIDGTLLQFPDRNSYVGPWISGGNVYTMAVDKATDVQLRVYKATDVNDSFAEQDSVNRPTVTDRIRSAWGRQVGTDLHISLMEIPALGDFRLSYTVFHMATDLFDGTLNDEQVDVSTGGDQTGILGACSIMVRGDGDVIIGYAGETDKIMGQERDRIDYARREGGTWTPAIQVDDGGAFSWYGCIIAPGTSDRTHFFIANNTDFELYQRTLRSDNSLETFPSAGDTTIITLENFHYGPGMSYDDGGTQRIRVPYKDADGTISYAEIDSVDSPGAFTPNTGISDNDVISLFSEPVMCSVVDPDTNDEHLIYSHITERIPYHDKNKGVDVKVLENALVSTFDKVSCNFYFRENGNRLAYVYNDGGTLKYGEVASLPVKRHWMQRNPLLRM